MKAIKFSVLAIFLVIIASCQKSDDDVKITTGLIGNVQYGEGDCMPIIDENSRVYENYTGEVYFILKSDLENISDLEDVENNSFDELKAKSISKKVVKGKLEIQLPEGTFVVMPSEVYVYSADNTVVIKKGVVLEKNFKFWKCTSY